MTHQNLLKCAKDHFLKYGFDKANIREICKSANVTNGAFYCNFKDKEAMFSSNGEHGDKVTIADNGIAMTADIGHGYVDLLI